MLSKLASRDAGRGHPGSKYFQSMGQNWRAMVSECSLANMLYGGTRQALHPNAFSRAYVEGR